MLYYRAPSDRGLYILNQSTIDHHLVTQRDFFRAAPIQLYLFQPHGSINQKLWRGSPWNAVSPFCQQCGEVLHASSYDGQHADFP